MAAQSAGRNHGHTFKGIIVQSIRKDEAVLAIIAYSLVV
jgi:hypothetical protein